LYSGRNGIEHDLKPQRWRADDASSTDRLQTALANQQPERLTIVGVPNARVWAGVHAWETICDVASPATAGELRKKLESFTIAGIDPEVFWQLGESLGYDV